MEARSIMPAAGAVNGVPPGPGLPVPLQTLAMMTRQHPYLARLRRRFGPLLTVRVLGLGTLVLVADPELIKQTFQPTRGPFTPEPSARCG